jgi:hypothetical protein
MVSFLKATRHLKRVDKADDAVKDMGDTYFPGAKPIQGAGSTMLTRGRPRLDICAMLIRTRFSKQWFGVVFTFRA